MEKLLKLKPFQQKPDFCGQACLKIVFENFGVELSEKEIVKGVKCGKKGAEAEDLLKFSKKLGFRGFVKDFSSLSDIRKYIKKKIPVIVEWFYDDDGHFSVVSGIDRENIYLQDPDLGHTRAMSLKLFRRLWFTFPGEYIYHREDINLRRMLVIYK
ncbi:MAG: cysteine peptidase family C39 domain-containing protein [archaeon]